MDKRTIILAHDIARQTALQAVKDAPDGYAVVIQERNRTLDQNAKFHAICSDLAKSGIEWAGRQRTLLEWKVLLVSGHAVATNTPAEIVPGLEGEFINLRESTANMGKKRGSSLIEYSLAWCAMHDVRLKDAA